MEECPGMCQNSHLLFFISLNKNKDVSKLIFNLQGRYFLFGFNVSDFTLSVACSAW
jgi:hypothetical protein